eukprot:g6141.t1
MAKGLRKKRRPSGNAGARKNAPISKGAGDEPAPAPAPAPRAPLTPTTSVEGDKERPSDESRGISTAAAASEKLARGSGASGSTENGGLSLGEGNDGAPAAAAAAAAAAAVVAAADGFDAAAAAGAPVIEGEKVLAGTGGESPRELASSSPGGGAEGAAIAESGPASTDAAASAASAASAAFAAAAAAGLGTGTLSEEELDASMCSEMDEWIAVGDGGGAPEVKDASLQPQGGDDAHGTTGSEIPEAQVNALTLEASAPAAAVVEAAEIAVGGEGGAETSPDHALPSSVQGSDGEGFGTGAGESSASVEVVPQVPTAPVIAEEEASTGSGGSPEPPAEAEAVPNPTAIPPLDVGATGAGPDPAAQAETASLTAATIPALEQELREGPPWTKDTPAGTVPVAPVETLAAAAATTVPVALAPEPPGAAVADSELQTAGRDSVDGEEPQPRLPPSSAAPTATCAEAGDNAVGTRAATDALKEDLVVDGAVGFEHQQLSAAEVVQEQEPAPASAEAAKEGTATLASTGGVGSREKAAAAKAAAEAATAAAVLASADAATAAEAAAAAIADAEAALEAVAEAEAGACLPPAARDGAGTTPTLTTNVVVAAAAADERVAAVPTSAKEGSSAQERTASHAAAAAAAVSDAATGPAAAPFVPTFPPLFLDTRSESSEAAPAAGATILTGSVGADVFSSRSAGGPCPWPAPSDGPSDGAGSDDGFGGSSRNRMSVEEAAAFMNLGSSGGGGGGGFASKSSWATTGTSAVDTTAESAEACAVPAPGSAAGGGFGDTLSSVGSLSRHGSFFTVGGAPSPFIGHDDFLSPSSVGGMGALNRRRQSTDAAVLKIFASDGGAALAGRDMGVRRATAAEMGSRWGVGSGTASALAGGAAVAGPKTSPAGVAGATTGRCDDGDTGSGGGLRSSPSAKEDAVGGNPSATQKAQSALLVRKGEAGGGSKTAVVVEAAVAAGHGESSAAAGSAIVKNPDGGGGGGGDGGFATGDSAATSCAGGEGGVGSPSPLRSAGAEAAIPGPSGTASGGEAFKPGKNAMEVLHEVPQAALLVGASASAACVFLALVSAFRRSPKDAPPFVRTGIPVLGNIRAYVRSPVNMIRDCYEKYGGVFTVPLAGVNFTYLIGPEAQASFYKLNDDTLCMSDAYASLLRPLFGRGIMHDAHPKKRNQQMQHMSYGLRAARVKAYVPKIEKEARDFLESWGDSGEVELYPTFSRLITLVAARCLLGDEVRENLFENVARLFNDLGEGMTALSVFLPYAPIPAHRRRDKARKEMVALFSDIIKSRRTAKAAGTVTEEKTDMLQVLIDLKYKDGSFTTDREIAGMLSALLFGGQHTTAITSTWTALFATRDPNMLARVMEEQQRVLKDPTTPLTWENLGEMELLHNIMREALRKNSMVTQLLRVAKKNFTVTSEGRSFTIPEGHYVGTSPYLAMHLPEVFKNPDEFDPDRYGPERQEHKQPYAYVGFGAGPHQCMGQQLAYAQVKTIVSVLLREYDIEIVGDFPEPDFEIMVAPPRGKCMVRYTKKTVSSFS